MGAPSEKPAGKGVDPSDDTAVDPTKNVFDLVQAAIERQDDLREALEKLVFAKLDTLATRLDGNDRRQNDLSTQREAYESRITSIKENCDHRIADILQKSASDVQVTRTGQVVSLDARITRIEQSLSEERGKAIVRDPQDAKVLAEMSATLLTLKGSTDAGRTQVIAWVIAGIAGLIAAVSAIAAVVNIATKAA